MKNVVRFILLPLLVGLAFGVASAQNTTTTGTVTDSDSIAWANGTITFSVVGTSGTLYCAGTPMTAAQSIVRANLDGSGAFSQSLCSNTSITPVNSQWSVVVCSATTAPCQNLGNTTISGGSQSLTSFITASIKPLRIPIAFGTRAYADIEISNPPTGGQYYNLTSSSSRFWNGTSWAGLGGNVDLLSSQKPTGTPWTQTIEHQFTVANQEVTVAQQTGSGYISSIAYICNNSNNLYNSTFKVYVNGNASPTINMPLENYFEAVYQSNSGQQNKGMFQNALFGYSGSSAGQTVFSYLAIPYNNGIRVTITTPTAGDLMWTDINGTTIADGFPNSEKLWASSNVFPGTAPLYKPIFYVNYTGKNPGRFVGLWMMHDPIPAGENPLYCTLEGNFRIYTDNFNAVYATNTAFTVGQTIVDTSGNIQTVSTAGTTSGSAPTWGFPTGVTTTDGTVTWTATSGQPPNIYMLGFPYPVAGLSILDGNGNVETVITPGTANVGAEPTWCTTNNCITIDGTVHWQMSTVYSHAAITSSGTEDYFQMGNYFSSTTNPGSVGVDGVNFISPTHNGAIGAFRFHLPDPLRFNNSLAVLMNNGDQVQCTMTSGNPYIWTTAYWYTQDTN